VCGLLAKGPEAWPASACWENMSTERPAAPPAVTVSPEPTERTTVIAALLVASWIWGIAALGVLGFIGLAIYSGFQLRNPDNWEERQPKRRD
jgi:hypothetical protein